MSAAAAQRVLPLVDAFCELTPGYQVRIRETALADLYGPLRRAEVDLSPLPLPVDEPDLAVGPVLLSEAAMLAVAVDHPLAGHTCATSADLADQTVLFAQNLPTYWIDHHLSVPEGSATVTPRTLTLPGFQEILAYVTAGHGVAIVGAQTEHLYPGPGLICVPIAGPATFDYALVWCTDRLSAAAAAFLRHVTS